MDILLPSHGLAHNFAFMSSIIRRNVKKEQIVANYYPSLVNHYIAKYMYRIGWHAVRKMGYGDADAIFVGMDIR